MNETNNNIKVLYDAMSDLETIALKVNNTSKLVCVVSSAFNDQENIWQPHMLRASNDAISDQLETITNEINEVVDVINEYYQNLSKTKEMEGAN